MLYAWAALVSILFAGPASAALTLSTTKVTVPVSGSALVTISGASGEIQAESKNTAVTTVSLSNRTTTGATLTVRGVGAGTATVYVRDRDPQRRAGGHGRQGHDRVARPR